MKKTLAIATLALGLFAFGCDDDEDGGKIDAATDAAKPDATADAVTNTPDAKADTASTADATDGGTNGDATESDGGAVDWTACGTDPKAGVTPAEFCVQYMKACTFDSTGGTLGMERYKSLSDCVMAYQALSETKQGCAAYHLCVASVPAMSATHCPHPPEVSLVPAAGPCAAK
jgi:hypothetical protein